ncbi:D-2-hydroxyacid dehydrogenase [Alteromonas sp. S167]|jgi:glycerate dehydrogenase|uniref:D-2-hydroxyacid dehydrogenase n=1 Tax=Alteromonas sp. S167 TaxID=3117402 RepID=UPI002FE40510
MSQHRIVFLDAETLGLASLDSKGLTENFTDSTKDGLSEGLLEAQANSIDADVTIFDNTAPSEVKERIRHASVILVNKVVLNADTLSAANSLKYIGVTATGMNNIDLDYCNANGIEVRNVTAYGTDSVAQHTLTLLLNVATRFVQYQHDVHAGKWSASPHFCLSSHPVVELAGKHAVIVGHGELGKRVEVLLKALGMRVSIAARPGKKEDTRPSLSSLLPHADVVTLHCPLTDDTNQLIDANALSLMKPSCFLINTARGGLVDEHALLNALMSKQLGGAGLDVLSVEPPPEDHILLKANLPNLIISPHNAWIGVNARQTLLDKTVEQLKAFIADRGNA